MLPIYSLLFKKLAKLLLDNDSHIPFSIKQRSELLHCVQKEDDFVAIVNKQLQIGKSLTPMFQVMSKLLELRRNDRGTITNIVSCLTPGLLHSLEETTVVKPEILKSENFLL